MARFRLLLEYDGTRYSGWQIQKNARTIQGELLRIMRAPEIIRMKVNDLLPPDINILEVDKVPPAFHARHDAIAREYLYKISRRRTAFGKRYVWWVKGRLDVNTMRQAAQRFTGMKDWRSFTDADPEEGSTKALIHSLRVDEEGDLILIRIVGSHFLWKLVRRIVGVLVETGRGTLAMREFETIFSEGSDYAAKHTAPPSGLYLESVRYADDIQIKPASETRTWQTIK